MTDRRHDLRGGVILRSTRENLLPFAYIKEVLLSEMTHKSMLPSAYEVKQQYRIVRRIPFSQCRFVTRQDFWMDRLHSSFGMRS